MIEITDIHDFLSHLKTEEFLYIPNPGNAGDSLIAYGTIQVFDSMGLKWAMGDISAKYNNRTLVFGGGGNLVGLYPHCRRFLINNHENNRIIVLPHTVKEEDKPLAKLGKNVTIICREINSYKYLYDGFSNLDIRLSPDMAFHINPQSIEKFRVAVPEYETGNCFRRDTEKTNLQIPAHNTDISIRLNEPGNVDNKDIIRKISEKIFDYVAKYKVIKTNRLHVAIASSLIGREVYFYPNSYYKNEAVYNFWLYKYENCTFVKNSDIV